MKKIVILPLLLLSSSIFSVHDPLKIRLAGVQKSFYKLRRPKLQKFIASCNQLQRDADMALCQEIVHSIAKIRGAAEKKYAPTTKKLAPRKLIFD